MYNAVLFSPSFISFFTVLLFQTTGTLVVAAAFCVLFRKRTSAALRHLVWSLSLIGIFGLPILYCAASRWPAAPHLRLLSPSRGLTRVLERHDPRGTESAGAVSPSVSLEPQKTAPRKPISEQGQSLAPHAPENGSYREDHGESTSVAHTTSAVPRFDAFDCLVRFGFIAYVSGVTLLFLRLGVGLAQLSRLRRISLPVTEANIMRAVTEAQRRRAQSRNSAQMSVRHLPSKSQRIIPPMTWGVKQPVVLLPTEAASWPDDQIVVTLLHEMAHIERRDWPVQIMAQIACAFYWFHPLVWIAARALRAESENACDDRVISSGIPSTAYATHLLEVARFVTAAAASSADAQTGRNMMRQVISSANMALPGADTAIPMASQRSQPSLETRLRAILQNGRNRRTLSVRQASFASLTAALLIVLGSSLQVSSASATPDSALPPESDELTKAAAKDASAALPNGASLHLAALADTQHAGSPTHWWTPEGLPLDRKLPDMTLPYLDFPNEGLGRAIAVATAYNPAAQPQIEWAHSPIPESLFRPVSLQTDTQKGSRESHAVSFYPPRVHWDFRPARKGAPQNCLEEYETTAGATTTAWQVIPAAFLAADREATVRLGVAAGPWTQSADCGTADGRTAVQTAEGSFVTFTVDTHPNPRKGSSTIRRGNAGVMVTDNLGRHGSGSSAGVSAGGPTFTDYGAGVPLFGSGQPSFDRVILALDKNGHVVYDFRTNSYVDVTGTCLQQASIPIALLKQAKTLRFFARPIYWTEFRNVPLHPRVAAALAAQASQSASVAASVATHIAKGRLLERIGQPRDGKPEYLQAAALDPNDAEAHYLLAHSLYATNFKRVGDTINCLAASPADMDDAIRHLKIAVALRPQDAGWRSELGTYLSNRGNYADALAEYRRSLRLLPDIAPYDINAKTLGNGSANGGGLYSFARSEEARRVASEHWLIADTLMKTHAYGEALHHYRIASAFQPKAEWVLLGMGDALYHLDKLPEARQVWRQVVRVGAPNTYYRNEAETRLKEHRTL